MVDAGHEETGNLRNSEVVSGMTNSNDENAPGEYTESGVRTCGLENCNRAAAETVSMGDWEYVLACSLHYRLLLALKIAVAIAFFGGVTLVLGLPFYLFVVHPV